MLKGSHHSEETKQKMSESRRGSKNHMYGRHHADRTKRKQSEKMKEVVKNSKTIITCKKCGKKLRYGREWFIHIHYCYNPMSKPENREKVKQALRHPDLIEKRWRAWLGDKNPAKRLEVRRKISKALKGKSRPDMYGKNSPVYTSGAYLRNRGENNPAKRPEVREKISRKMKKIWADPEYKSRNIKRLHAIVNRRPNKMEESFQNLFSDGITYNGYGEVIIGGKVPDFIVNNKNKVIELYGDYWHRGDDPMERINLFSREGYDCLVIWEHELKNELSIKERVNTFIGDSDE